MPRVPPCDVCGKPARRGRKVGTLYACEKCLAKAECTCGNLEMGFDCVCQWVKEHPGSTNYDCEFCGIYTAGAPRCNKCKSEPAPKPRLSSFVSKLKSDNVPHVIVEARAGTGKTTTLIEGLKVMRGLEVSIEPSPQQAAVWEQLMLSANAGSVCFVAFNKSISTELQNRVPEGCSAMTMHSMGFKAVQATFGRLKVNQYRVQDLISSITGRDIRELRKTKMEVLKATEQLVGLCKMNLVDGEREALWDLASYYDIDLNGSSAEIFSMVPQVLERCKDVSKDRCVDFNDMIWLPVALGLSMTKYDLLLVDEAQDLNRCQQQLAMMAGRRLVLCGDPKQAIYGFAGADAESMSRMQKTLEATERGCVHLPLTVTRRCGKAIVAEAQKIVPDFGYWETNPEGKISQASYKEHKRPCECRSQKCWDSTTCPVCGGTGERDDCYTSQVQDGNMILCRVNAPLVSQCFRFLKAGRKATIQGRDVGQGLISTVKKLKADSVPDLSSKLSDWLHCETMKETAKRNPNENKLIALQDRVDCLYCFMEGQSTIEDVVAKIEAVFTDDKSSPGIKLSSIHKAKGLEADRVFALMPEGCGPPHPMAKTNQAREQESHLLYVMITRAREELIYVS